jgi:hypothetical protein
MIGDFETDLKQIMDKIEEADRNHLQEGQEQKEEKVHEQEEKEQGQEEKDHDQEEEKEQEKEEEQEENEQDEPESKKKLIKKILLLWNDFERLKKNETDSAFNAAKFKLDQYVTDFSFFFSKS